ncbi:MAG: hypothetical protein WAK20_08085 [Candidatus Acidiferrum sp.]
MSTNRKPTLLALVLMSAISFGLIAEAAQKKSNGSVFVTDKGKLNILLDNSSVGQEEFEIIQSGGSWVAKGNSSIKVPGTTPSSVTGNLSLQPDGTPLSYDWTAQTEKTNSAHVVFSNGVAKMTLQMQGARPFEQDLTFSSPAVVVLDNNLYHQYAVLARVYNWSRKGTQNFSVLIPQELTPGTITVTAGGDISSNGKTYESLKVVTSDLEVVLYLDNNHRLMRIEVPSAKVTVVRE